MAAINFPTATSNGQTFTADTGVIYTYIGTPPNGFWSGTFGTTGLATLDGRFLAKNDNNSIQTIQTQGLKFNNGNADTILLDGVNSKIGIGTTSPGRHLHINGGSESVKIQITNTTTGSSNDGEGFQIGIATNGTANIEQRENADLVFATNNTERMRIISTGNVGIGVTSPSDTLHLNGATGYGLKITDSSSHIAVLRTHSDGGILKTASNHDLLFGTNDTERMRIDSSGNVGIGITSPQTQLHSSGTTNGAQATFGISNSGLKISTFQKTGNDAGVVLDAQEATNGTLVFRTCGSERLRIDNSGRVGIKTSSMGSLYVGGDDLVIGDGGSSNQGMTIFTGAAQQGIIAFADSFTGASGQYAGYLLYDHSEDRMTIATAGAERLRIRSDGNVGIGTTNASSKLVVVGTQSSNLQLKSSPSASHGLELWNDSAVDEAYISNYYAGPIIFQTTNAERMRLDASGRLGIGTSNPAFNLDISPASGAAQVKIAGAEGQQASIRLFADQGDDSADIKRLLTDTSGNFKIQHYSGGNYVDSMVIDSSGRVGIGCTPSSSFQLKRATPELSLQPTSNSQAGYITFINTSSTTKGAIEYAYSNDHMAFKTDSVERMRIASSGNVGIGTTSIANRRLTLHDSSASSVYLNVTNANSSSGGSTGFLFGITADADPIATIWNYESSPMRFATANAERMRIESSGNVLFGKTGTDFATSGVEIRPAGEIVLTRSGDLITTRRVSTEGTHISIRNVSGTIIGSVSTNGSATSFNTNSDYRLKENVVDLVAAIPRLKALPVYRFNFIGSDITVDGFIAHEAQLVVPEAVSGTHNEIDGDGNPIMQSIDQAKVVPLVTAALQEAIGRIEALEAEIAALKAG